MVVSVKKSAAAGKSKKADVRAAQNIPKNIQSSEIGSARPSSHSDILGTLSNIPSRQIDLPSIMAQRMHERFGVPFDGGKVKVFRDSGLEDLGQRGYARGNEIHIAGNESAYDEKLMLHEATHVVQQGAGLARGGGILQDRGLETQANAPSYMGSVSLPTSGGRLAEASSMPVQGWNPFTWASAAVRGAYRRVKHGKKESDEKIEELAADSLQEQLPQIIASPGSYRKNAQHVSDFIGLTSAVNSAALSLPGLRRRFAEHIDV